MRQISLKELKTIIREELGKALDPSKLKIKIQPWWKAEAANQLNWLKQLKISEILAHRLGK